MQPPWIILHLFFILVTVGDYGVSCGLLGSEVDIVSNVTKSQKHIIERGKRLIPYKTYYVTQTRANPIQETRALLISSTTPKVPEFVTIETNGVSGQLNPQQYTVRAQTVFSSTLAPTTSQARTTEYQDSNKKAQNFEIFRSIEPIPTIKQEIAQPAIPQRVIIPVRLIKLVPYSPQTLTRHQGTNQPIRGFISHSNFLTERNNRPSNSDANNSVRERKVYAAVNDKKRPSSSDGNSKIRINAINLLPANVGEIRAYLPETLESNKIKIPKVLSGYLVEKKGTSERERPLAVSNIADIKAGIRAANRGPPTPTTRLKVPQENEIRFVVNLTPVRPSHNAVAPTLPVVTPEEKDSEHKDESDAGKPSTVDSFLSILKETNKLPKNLTPENIDNGIKTLALILERLQKEKQIENIQSAFNPVVSTVDNGAEQVSDTQKTLNNLKKHQTFPQASGTSTPGRPGIDYPTYSTIPQTKFDCSTQRYKGFFGDPETKCQVWHYCDLNGGQASFLCPNGTIFSQVALTCDWWFNVKCASTSQLYVLNERLYKYILPFSPSFPEDYSGPVVDRYLTAKFNEMERKSKLKALKSLSTTTASTYVPQTTSESTTQ